ncbi:helix-turn-helix domain-containing protein [Paenarthrobacter sp. NPDC058040]|uniref:helix-turn-helix domain-containing protein n=1 Tax=unclassified Paenarthrobacter TaxID=2634190 RepID=UPI0036DED1B4
MDEVLDAIVHRARVLMGAELTYIQVYDPETDGLSTRAAEGVITTEFIGITVPPNVGISRLVMAQRAPHWSREFSTDSSFAHDSHADAVVAREGMRAVLAAPMIVRDRSVGVIYAGYRRERSFSPDEVALLAAFADHAAIAMENSRLFEESQSALSELRSAYEVIESQMSAARLAEELHTAMTETILHGGNTGDVAEILVDSLEGEVTILDRLNDILVRKGGVTSPSGTAGPLIITPPVTDAIGLSRRTGRVALTGQEDGTMCAVAAIVADGTYMGSIVHRGQSTLDASHTATLERAGQVSALMTLIREARLDAEERVRGELLTEILSDGGLSFSEELSMRAHSRKVPVADIRCVAVVYAEEGLLHGATRVLHDIARNQGGLAGEHMAHPTLLATAASGLAETAERISEHLARALKVPVLVCTAPTEASPAAVARAFMLASRCVRLAKAMGISGRGITTEQFGLYGMLFDPERSDALREFLQSVLGPVINHDEKTGTSLAQTLSAYFENAGNQARTARALHVHINTLLKRLERISTLLGEDWTTPDRSLQIQLATRLHSLDQKL